MFDRERRSNIAERAKRAPSLAALSGDRRQEPLRGQTLGGFAVERLDD
jgi:hypothetical protein